MIFEGLNDLQSTNGPIVVADILSDILSQILSEIKDAKMPPPRELRSVRLTERLEDVQGGEPGSQVHVPSQWSGSQTSSAFPSWLGSPSSPPTSSASPPWSGSQTYPTPPPWSGHQGNVHQDYWLPASTLKNHTMLQQSPLPSPIPGFSPPLPPLTCQAGSVNGSTWGLLPALVTA